MFHVQGIDGPSAWDQLMKVDEHHLILVMDTKRHIALQKRSNDRESVPCPLPEPVPSREPCANPSSATNKNERIKRTVFNGCFTFAGASCDS